MSGSGRLAGKVALIFGSGSVGPGWGNGRATATRFAEEGAQLFGVDRELDRMKETLERVKEVGGTMETGFCDVTSSQSISDAVDACMKHYGRIDILVNNAGIFDVKHFFELTAADFEHMYAVNTVPMFTLARLAAPRMAHGGRIINLASRAALGARHYAHYVASKSAVLGLTRAMALELAPLGITVNAVSPGVIETGMLKSRSDTNLDALRTLQPLGRLGTPDDVARTIAFLADPAADFITGQVILVDGGRSLGGIIA